jgi:hypothetical protein
MLGSTFCCKQLRVDDDGRSCLNCAGTRQLECFRNSRIVLRKLAVELPFRDDGSRCQEELPHLELHIQDAPPAALKFGRMTHRDGRDFRGENQRQNS